MIIKLTLPMPPSINKAYNGKIRRYKSKEYRDWLKLCESTKNQRYKVNGTEKIIANYSFYSNWYNKDGSIKIKDLSNYFKLMEDYLKNLIKGFDDKQIFLYNNIKKIQSDKEVVKIMIEELF